LQYPFDKGTPEAIPVRKGECPLVQRADSYQKGNQINSMEKELDSNEKTYS